MDQRKLIVVDDPLQTLLNCDAIYTVPRDVSGKYAGPLVGFTSGVIDDDGRFLQHVGEQYINTDQLIRYPEVASFFVNDMYVHLKDQGLLDTFSAFVGVVTCGVPLACELARLTGKEVLIARKAANGQRLDKYSMASHHAVWIVDDVVNSGSTARTIIDEVTHYGDSRAAGISCIVNRSPQIIINKLSIVSSLHLPQSYHIYHQNDERVRGEVVKKNVIWHPKYKWGKLMSIMQEHS